MTKKNILLHVHIFKNAGSSFDDALHHFFGDAFVDHRDDEDIVRGKMDYLTDYLDNHPNIQAFSSHSIHFLPVETDTYRFFTTYFLRHPIDRIRSVYSFEKKQLPASTQGSVKAKELEFVEYLGWYMQDDSPATIRNVQTIFLSGKGPAPANIQEKFEMAFDNLQHFPLVGIVDRYDESMVVFEEYLKQFFTDIDLSYIRKNITDENIEASVEEKAEKLLSGLDEEIQALVKEKNEFDIKLYRLANKLLDEKINKINNFQNKLNNFKDRCQIKQLQQKIYLKKYDEAIIETQKHMDQEHKNIQYYLINAEALIGVNRFKDALHVYDKAVKLHPSNMWPLIHKIKLLKKLNEVKDLNASIELFNKSFSDNKQLLHNIIK